MAVKNNQQTGWWATIKELAFLLIIVFLIRTFGFGLYQVPTGSMETTMLVGERFFADKFSYLFTDPKINDIISMNDPTFSYSPNSLVRLAQNYLWMPQNLTPQNWTKRVIGVPGDHIKGVVEDGVPVVYRNEKKLEEPYLNRYPLLTVWKDGNVLSAIDQKTYDPKKPYDDQPFYRINKDNVVKQNLPAGMYDGITIDADGRELREPRVPVEKKRTFRRRKGKSYWTGTDDFDIHLGENEYWMMGDNRRGSLDSRVFGPVERKHIHGRIVFRIWSIDSNEDWWIVDLIKHPIDFWKRMRWGRFFQRVK